MKAGKGHASDKLQTVESFMQDEEKPSAPSEEVKSQEPVVRGPQGIELPAEQEVLREARLLVGNGDVRINEFANLIATDPVLTLELLKVANATFFAGDRPPATTVRAAVVRLGSGTIVDVLEQVKNRPSLEPSSVAVQFELLRALSSQVSTACKIIAGVASRDLAESAQTAGLMFYVGHMVACAYLGEDYVHIANSKHHASLTYKLQQDYNFDVRGVHLNYLRLRGVPQELFYALDRDLQCKTTAQANLRFVVHGAAELVEAVHSGKWEKYAPAHPLPAKSALRLLKISDHQYEQIYESIEALFHKEEVPEEAEQVPAQEKTVVITTREVPKQVKQAGNSSSSSTAAKSTSNVDAVLTQKANFITHESGNVSDDSGHLSVEAMKTMMLIQELCLQCRTTQELLSAVMTLVITEGPYSRAALILVGDERQSASIHTAVGEGFDQNPDFAVVDPLSPLALCLTKIKSFNAQGLEDSLSPFGITSYAVSPINVDVEGTVVLYADCGVNRSLPMEARKVFRLVVGLLNRILPSLPGGLPKRNYRRNSPQSGNSKLDETSVA